MKKANLNWFFLIVLAIVWGSSFILMKKALIDLSPIQVGALRILISGLVLIVIGYKTIANINKQQWLYIFITAMIGTFIPAFLFAFAVYNIDSSIASILNSLTPLNTLIIGFIIFGFTFKKHQLLGIVLGFLGTAILIFKGASLNPGQNYMFAALPILSSIGYAFNVNILKKHLSELSALTITVGNFVLLIIPAFVVLWFSDFFQTFEYTPAKQFALIYISILAVVGTAFAKIIFNNLVHRTTPLFASSVTYLIPVVAVFWGVLDHEKLTLIQFFAGIIILGGVYLTNRK